MDLASLGGLIIGLGFVILAYLLEGGKISAILQLPAIMLVIGGTIGASMVTTSFETIRNAPSYLKIAFFGKPMDPRETIDRIVHMAERARRDGILGLEGDLKTITNPFFRKAVQLVIDGTETSVLREILETEVNYISGRHKKGILLFQKMGGFSPTLGILGTVLGLINTLANTEDASQMAGHIAAAFIATLWGVGMANLIYLPIGDKLKHRHEEEMIMLELITEGALSIQSGDNPRVIRTKLLSFINPKLREGE